MNAALRIESLPELRIPLSQLFPSPRNVRKTGGLSIDQLAASISAEGLLQNLVVTQAAPERYEVEAGGRRLKALQKLAKEGRWGADQEVRCTVVTTADASKASLAENAIREAMHPADQAEAFRRLIEDEKQSEDDVAARFGVVVRYVRQRLVLAKLSPKILAAFREDKLTLAKAEAFASVNDHARQEKVFKGLQRWQGEDDIRAEMQHGEVPLFDRRVKLVGLDVYKAAGGPVREDLFGKPEDASIVDVKLLDNLVAQAFEKEKAKLLAAGWSFVDAGPDIDEWRYQRAQKLDKTKHGVVVTMGHGGKFTVVTGVLKLGSKEKGATSASSSSSKKKAKPKKPGELSFAQRQQLQAHRTVALRLHLAESPRIAMAGLAAALLKELFRDRNGSYDYNRTADQTIRIASDRLNDRAPLNARDLMDKLPATKLLAAKVADLKKRAAGAKSLFAWLLEQPEAVTHEALALAAGAGALTVQTLDREDVALDFCGLADLHMEQAWQVTPEWLNQQPSGFILAALEEAYGKNASATAQARAAKGKARLVATAAPMLRGWLPKPLRHPDWDFEPAAQAGGAGDVCKYCGCTDMNACQGGCGWAAPGVCSQCVDKDLQAVTGKRAPKKAPTSRKKVAKVAKRAAGVVKKAVAAARKKVKAKPIAKTVANSKAGKFAARRAANKAKKR